MEQLLRVLEGRLLVTAVFKELQISLNKLKKGVQHAGSPCYRQGHDRTHLSRPNSHTHELCERHLAAAVIDFKIYLEAKAMFASCNSS